MIGAIAVGALLCVGLIRLTAPEPQREGAVKRTAALVEVAHPEAGSFVPRLEALGAVRAVDEVWLQPRVSGQVVVLGEGFVPGRVVPEGAPLVQLDPADARNTLAQRQSALQSAEADLALEQGRQAVARTERAQIPGDISPEQEALILREPQRAAAEAAVAAARAAVRQASLELDRTRVVAPFDALVLERSVNRGSLVSPGVVLGRLVGVDRFWVELTVPGRLLPHLGGEGAAVTIRDRAAWPEGVTREGRLESVVSHLDGSTRMARLLVAVDDPLALDGPGPALLAGAFVEAHVAGAPLVDVVRVDRRWIRKGDTVWVMEDGALAIREVDIVLEDADHAYLRAGVSPEDAVVVTDLSTVAPGAPLRTAGTVP